MGSYLIDTNVSIGYFGEKMPVVGLDFIDTVINLSVPQISIITTIELLGFNSNSKEIELLKIFIENSVVFELSKEIVDATILIRKQKKIKIPDAIIAATALVFDLTLLTRNTEDFKGIAGLKIVNPWMLKSP